MIKERIPLGHLLKMHVKDERRKMTHQIFKLFMGIGLLVFALLGYGIYWAFFDMDRLPTGEYLTEETSPDGKYTLKAYITNGGATTSYAVRGELVFNHKNHQTKNIYWNTKEESTTIIWTDHDTVVINGHALDVPNDTFDFRNQ